MRPDFTTTNGIDYLKKRPDELLVDVHLPAGPMAGALLIKNFAAAAPLIFPCWRGGLGQNRER